MFKLFLITLLVAAAVADRSRSYRPPRPSYRAPSEEEYDSPEVYRAPRPSYDSSEESYEDAKYNFDWKVSEESFENHFGQTESRDGDQTKGSYYVQLPDGRTQTVTYYVNGDGGYVADVKYDGSLESYERDSHSDESYERNRYHF